MKNIKKSNSGRWENISRNWYRYSRNPLSVIGLAVFLLIILIVVFAPYIAPHPASAGNYLNFSEASKPPQLSGHLLGTDVMGRDILTRIIFGYRYSLKMVIVVLGFSLPVGIFLGLLAGYYKNNWLGILIIRLTDVFISIPPLILAMVICVLLTASAFNAMIAISLTWWPWYTRMVYSSVSSIREEFYVHAAELIGASRFHILAREILPNCISSVITKATLDVGWVVLTGASLSFVGLGAQPPTPDLGSMVAAGCAYIPAQWWITLFPALAIILLVLSGNLIGDGISEIFGVKVR